MLVGQVARCSRGGRDQSRSKEFQYGPAKSPGEKHLENFLSN